MTQQQFNDLLQALRKGGNVKHDKGFNSTAVSRTFGLSILSKV